jgi:hypothetical protein
VDRLAGGVVVADVVFVALTIGCFGLLAGLVRAVERL